MESKSDHPQIDHQELLDESNVSQVSGRASSQITQNVQGDRNVVIGSLSDNAKAIAHIGTYIEKQIHQSHPLQLSLHQLPSDVADFTGRDIEIQQLIVQLQPTQGQSAPAIAALSGMGGVGKSALAIHVAHQLKHYFPDAQLYVDLRGDNDQPLEALEVLGQWLRDIGFIEADIPTNQAGRAKAYRSWLASGRSEKEPTLSKRALVLLDNAKDINQVEPLLPGAETCAVLITSRQSLGSLPGGYKGNINLAAMSETDALKFFSTLIGPDRLETDLNAARQIILQCGKLPLAVRIAGGTLNVDKGKLLSLKSYAENLEDEYQRLGKLHLDNLDVRASFSLSYRELNEFEAKVFQLIGLLLADFNFRVIKFLTGNSNESVLEVLERLGKLQLLQYVSGNFYRLHDLIRIFAQEKFVEINGLSKQAVILNNLGDFYERDIQWKNAVRYYEKSCRISRELKDQYGEATSFLGLGYIYSDVHGANKQLEKAFDYISSGLRLFQALGDKNGIARAQLYLGNIHGIQGNRQKAFECYEKSLENFRFSRNKAGESSALNGLGGLFLEQGEIQKASECYEQSVRIRFERGELIEAATGLRNIAVLYEKNEEWEVAVSYWKRSLQVYREAKDPLGEGDILDSLGDYYRGQNKLDKAIYYYQESLRICRSIDQHDWEDWEPDILLKLGNVYQLQNDFQAAVNYYEEGLSVCRNLCGYNFCRATEEVLSEQLELPTRFEAVRSIGLEIIRKLGSIYIDQGFWSNAIRIYQESLTALDELKDYSNKAHVLARLGSIYINQGHFQDAIDSYQQILEVFEKLENHQGKAQALHTLGDLYCHQEYWQDAINAYQRSLQLNQGLGDLHGEAVTLGSLSLAYGRQGRWHDAINLHQQSLQAFRELNDLQGEGMMTANLGLLYAKQDHLKEAITLYQTALTKLLPDSPEHATVTQWLQVVLRPRYPAWLSWLLPLAILLFLGWNLVKVHWLAALLGVLALISWQWFRKRR